MDYYEKLSRDIEAGKITPDDSTMTRDPQAGRAMFREVFGTDDLDAISVEDLRRGGPGTGRRVDCAPSCSQGSGPEPSAVLQEQPTAPQAVPVREDSPVLPAHHGRPRQTPLWGTSAPGQYG